MTFTFVDLFAGIGGFHAGLSELGGECLLAVEKDEQAARVYEANWGIDPRGDVTSSTWIEDAGIARGSLDVLAGGFPCQPFSKGGAQLGMSEARGTLFFEICKAIEAWHPAVVMLENVRNLVGPRHRHEWEVIVAALRELGYRVSSTPVILSPHWIDPKLGGTPQNRERVYILATRVGAEPAKLEVAPTIQLERFAAGWQLNLDLPLQANADLGAGEFEELRASADELSWMNAWDELVRELRAKSIQLPSFPIWVDSWFAKTPHAPKWKEVIETKNEVWFKANRELLEHWAATHHISSFPASRRKLEWQAGDAQSFEECLVQLRPSGLRVKKATHAGALVAIDQRPFVFSQGRRLSARECARLQGFPEWFSFAAAPRWAYKQLGNAVHVGSVRYALTSHVLAAETLATLGPTHPLVKAVQDATGA